jgi:hypothetical protein
MRLRTSRPGGWEIGLPKSPGTGQPKREAEKRSPRIFEQEPVKPEAWGRFLGPRT